MATIFNVANSGTIFGGGSSNALAYGSNVTVGDLLVCVFVVYHLTGSLTVTDTRGNTWIAVPGSLVQQTSVNYTNITCQIFYCINKATGANTVTGHWTTSMQTAYMTIAEVSGASVVDQVSTGQGSTCPPVSAGTVTTGQSSEACFLCGGSDGTVGSGGFAVTSGWTQGNLGAGGTQESGTAYQVKSTAGSLTGNFTMGGSGTNWCCSMVTFSAPAVAVGGTGIAQSTTFNKTQRFSNLKATMVEYDSPGFVPILNPVYQPNIWDNDAENQIQQPVYIFDADVDLEIIQTTPSLLLRPLDDVDQETNFAYIAAPNIVQGILYNIDGDIDTSVFLQSTTPADEANHPQYLLYPFQTIVTDDVDNGVFLQSLAVPDEVNHPQILFFPFNIQAFDDVDAEVIQYIVQAPLRSLDDVEQSIPHPVYSVNQDVDTNTIFLLNTVLDELFQQPLVLNWIVDDVDAEVVQYTVQVIPVQDEVFQQPQIANLAFDDVDTSVFVQLNTVLDEIFQQSALVNWNVDDVDTSVTLQYSPGVITAHDNDAENQKQFADWNKDHLSDEGVELITIPPTVPVLYFWDNDADQQLGWIPAFRTDDVADSGVEIILYPVGEFIHDEEQSYKQQFYYATDDFQDTGYEANILFYPPWDADNDSQQYPVYTQVNLADEGVEYIQVQGIGVLNFWDEDQQLPQAAWALDVLEDKQPYTFPVIVIPVMDWTLDAENQNQRTSYYTFDGDVDTSVVYLSIPALDNDADQQIPHPVYMLDRDVTDSGVEAIIVPQVGVLNFWDNDSDQQKLQADWNKDHLADEAVENIIINPIPPQGYHDADFDSQWQSPFYFDRNVADESVENIILNPIPAQGYHDADFDSHYQLGWQIDYWEERDCPDYNQPTIISYIIIAYKIQTQNEVKLTLQTSNQIVVQNIKTQNRYTSSAIQSTLEILVQDITVKNTMIASSVQVVTIH